MRIVLTGGGTGGHLLPFEGVVDALRAKAEEDVQMYFMGVLKAGGREFFEERGVKAIHVPSGKLRRYASSLTVIDFLLRLPIGILWALIRMYFLMPEVVISLGGYGSVPTVSAAAFYRIPILLHESDAVLGLANRKLARYASAISLGFAGAKESLGKYSYKAVITGTPVRDDIHQLTRAEARHAFEIDSGEHVLLITGGSQGARQLNEVVIEILPKLVLESTVIHLTGHDHFEAVQQVARELLAQSSRRGTYKPFAYLTETMAHALVAADSIVARAGASTLAEIAALKKPALIIPLDSAAGDHQRANAQVFESAGAALVLDPANLTRNLFENNVRRLISDPEARQHLVENLAALDYPDAAQNIADLALKLARGLAPTR